MYYPLLAFDDMFYEFYSSWAHCWKSAVSGCGWRNVGIFDITHTFEQRWTYTNIQQAYWFSE